MKTPYHVQTPYEAAMDVLYFCIEQYNGCLSSETVSIPRDLMSSLFTALDAFADTEAGAVVKRLLESGDHTTRDVHRDAARVIEAQATLAQIQAH